MRKENNQQEELQGTQSHAPLVVLATHSLASWQVLQTHTNSQRTHPASLYKIAYIDQMTLSERQYKRALGARVASQFHVPVLATKKFAHVPSYTLSSSSCLPCLPRPMPG